MGFLTTLRKRLADSVMHRPALCHDPVLGELEEIGGGLWRTLAPVQLAKDMEPVDVTVEEDVLGEERVGEFGREVFLELRARYPELRDAIEPLLCKVDPRACRESVHEGAVLSEVEILRDPVEGHPVVALGYHLRENPEYTYTVRLEGWHAVDVLISG